MKEEVWVDVVGYEKYYIISNCGNIKKVIDYDKKIYRDKKQYVGNTGYNYINLYKHNKVKLCTVHRLVAIAFLDNPQNKREVNHIDGVKTNTHVDNLEWVTPKENGEHASRTGLLVSRINSYKSRSIKTICIETNQVFDSAKEASRYFNIGYTSLRDRLNKNTNHKYNFKYL